MMNINLGSNRRVNKFTSFLGALYSVLPGPESRFVVAMRRHRLLSCTILCSLVSAFSFYLSFVIRFSLSELDTSKYSWEPWFYKTVGLVIVVRMGAFLIFGMHKITWRFAGAQDVIPVFLSTLVSSLVLAPTILMAWDRFFPRSVLVFDGIICFVIIAGVRFSFRIAEDLFVGAGAGKKTKVIVVGAGAAGNLIIRAMLTRGLVDYWPVAIMDDDPYKTNTTIQGIPVYGPITKIGEIAEKTTAEAIVMALPAASSSDFYKAIQICKSVGLPLKTTPDLAQILKSSSVVTRISDFKLEDLLHRSPVRSDNPEIQQFLQGRAVLVTGAAGSIGSELCRQIAEQGTRLLVCVDKDENGLFRLEHELKNLCGDTQCIFFLGDVKDPTRMQEMFAAWKPEVVFHAAAYKHVPVLQHHPVEAVRNNAGGTRNISELAHKYGVDQFVLISTDKAVNPTSVMGATKRIAERIVRSQNENSSTRFSIIRFGNVLGSAGSVVELFLKQIRTGQPITVTHKDIERFFMTIPEAVHLVLYSATMGRGGETFILDMGKPVKIYQLARQIIKLSGLTPDVDVPIKVTGLRPGEKLYEELWTDQEKPENTTHPGILQAPCEESLAGEQMKLMNDLVNSANRNELRECWDGLLSLVPSFQGLTSDLAHLPPDKIPDDSGSL